MYILFVSIQPLLPNQTNIHRHQTLPQYRHAAQAVTAQCSLRLSASRPLRLKPEVHKVAQRRKRRTKPRPHAICTQNFVRIGPAVLEICSPTDRQTHRQTGWLQYFAPIPGCSNKPL